MRADKKYLKVIRGFVANAVDGSMPESEVYFLELGLTEICENIIKYGYVNEEGRILIKIVVEDRQVSIIIIDRGKPFNIEGYTPVDKKELVDKGIKGKLGIRTIKTVCDKVFYKRLKKKNKTVLVKYLKKRKKKVKKS